LRSAAPWSAEDAQEWPRAALALRDRAERSPRIKQNQLRSAVRAHVPSGIFERKFCRLLFPDRLHHRRAPTPPENLPPLEVDLDLPRTGGAARRGPLALVGARASRLASRPSIGTNSPRSSTKRNAFSTTAGGTSVQQTSKPYGGASVANACIATGASTSTRANGKRAAGDQFPTAPRRERPRRQHALGIFLRADVPVDRAESR